MIIDHFCVLVFSIILVIYVYCRVLTTAIWILAPAIIIEQIIGLSFYCKREKKRSQRK